ncbi:hypothetical protein [Luteimonas sp. RC10]|uniref:hypothetical protein n=1 Tax=Luteimonas sp. RC10 TaxID=2587035 RepID=UPI00162223A7|nr:hypothetical protein [Luteimonas sp. RC10]MBB3342744.1 hypothetical protein [Luteimonas sp. RC10]
MNAKLLPYVACIAVLGVGNIATGHAADSRWIAPDGLLSADASMSRDVAGVADALGISEDAARRQLNVQPFADAIAERVRQRHANRLAGVYIEHAPSGRLVVRLTGHDAVRPEFHQFGADPLEVAYEVGADHTLADLQRRFDTGFPTLGQRMQGLQGGYVDERTGQIVIERVRGEKAMRQADVQRLAAAHFGVPVRVVEPDAPNEQQAVFGGGLLDYVRSGITYICTGGFVVGNTASQYGTLTAGHCQPTSGTYSYLGHDGASHSLTHVARAYNSTSDIGWARPVPAASVGPWVWTGAAYAQVTGRRTQAATTVGNVICRYGRTGGYGCATVFSKAYSPGSICGPAVPGTAACSATFVGLNSSAGLCQGGDSGGPWFIAVAGGVVAAGVHSAGNPSAGLCVYTSTDYAYSALGLSLVY